VGVDDDVFRLEHYRDADAVDLPRLRLAGEWRGDQARGDSIHEFSAVHYQMISVARASTTGGIVRPSP
jgi:hypothetical protein